ncbi:chromo domain protein LHP1-like [Silene latifolia]|uniref:chromo domain protein LHP1-like n=1 Tax=Silene latifolia TaxID=37657 RepID=UPI003D77FD23
MKIPQNTPTTSTTTPLLTDHSPSLTPSLLEKSHTPPPSPPYTVIDDSEEEEEEDDGHEHDDDEEDADDVEEREDEEVKVTQEQLISRQKKLADGFFEVEAIRKRRICKGEPQYLIKWRGWPESANTWEPVDHLQTCPDVVEAYEESLHGQKKNSSKRKRKFTQQKKKMQYSYGATKSKISPVEMPLNNDPQDSAALDNSKNAYRQPGMVDIVVEHDEVLKWSRAAKKVDRNGSQTVSPAVTGSEKDHTEFLQLSGQNASRRNLDEHLQQSVRVEGNGPSNQLSKSTCVEPGQSNQRRGAQRRKSGSVRRFTQDVTSLNIDCFDTPLPGNASTSEGNELLVVGSSDVFRKKRSDSLRSATITKIIKPISYSASAINDVQDVSVTFVVMRSDGKEVMVDNKYLKATNPLLLINFYEQHLRYNPT